MKQILCLLIFCAVAHAGYKKHEGKYCQPQSLGKFPTFDEARDECSKLEECSMFGEKIIRGSSQGFYLCGSPATEATTSSGATLYTKEEEILDTTGYKIHEGKYCQPQSLGKFPTFDDARDECSKLEECSMFGEKIIRGSSQGFYLCGSPATEASTSSGATLYTKEEEILDTTGYKIHEGKYCQPQSLGKFPTFDEARDECSKLEECSMFGEKIIRGSSQGFYLCGSPATEATTSSGATLYTKEEEETPTTRKPKTSAAKTIHVSRGILNPILLSVMLIAKMK